MKVKLIGFAGTPVDLVSGEQVVVELSERNVASLYHQGQVSVHGGDLDTPRHVYGSLVKTFEDGPRLVVHVVPDSEHYDDDGVAR